MTGIDNLTVKLFADGANKEDILKLDKQKYVKGFTTNPTLMRGAGIIDYVDFCKDILKSIETKPISFEVFSDDLRDMKRQALEIASWGKNVFCKIPVTNTAGESCAPLIEDLSNSGVNVNVTALFTLKQVDEIVNVLAADVPANISVFAGRIADTGRNAKELMASAVQILKSKPKAELIWASPRELYNIIEANEVGCHIITATPDILKKLDLLGYDLDQYSLDTVKMFREDSIKAGYKF